MIKIPVFKGRFDWNSQTNGLELLSEKENGADGSDRKRKSKSKLSVPYIHIPHHPRDKNVPVGLLGKSMRGMLSPVGNPGITPRMAGQAARISPRLGLHRKEKSTVTLVDVKLAAMADLNRKRLEAGDLVSLSFKELVNKDQFDKFLITLLRYFNCFFEGYKDHSKRPHKTNFLEPSQAEIKAWEETRKSMTVIKCHLGQAYCVLLLGIGIEKQHHMGCGKKRVSTTHRDKRMFEDVYLFCTSLVYITFRRRDLEKIRLEIGDMLRSPIYNPAARVTRRVSAEEQDPIDKPYVKDSQKPIGQRVEELLAIKLPKLDKLTPAEHRRQFGKRPAIIKAIHQRSSALASLLPQPQEVSDYLFKPTPDLRKQSIKIQKDAEQMNFLFQHDFYNLDKIGIIGELLDSFNPDTLIPKNMEIDDDNDSRILGHTTPRNRSSAAGTQEKTRCRILSRATTQDSIRLQ